MDNTNPARGNALSRLQNRLLLALATGLGVGLVPFAPGTFGSLWGPPLAWGLQELHGFGLSPAIAVSFHMTVSVLLWLLGVKACDAAIAWFGRKDPPWAVIDEIAAFPLVFAATRVTLVSAVVGFLWFRVFDILKPWPIRRVEYLPRGWGVMADDLVAALYAAPALWGTMQVLTWLGAPV
jgi:phosphatidylglycerophosphatase A